MKNQQKRNSARNQKRQQRKDHRLRDKVNENRPEVINQVVSDFLNDRDSRLQQAIERGDKMVDFDYVEKNRVYYGNLVRLGCKRIDGSETEDLFIEVMDEFLVKTTLFNVILKSRNQLIDWEAIVTHNNEEYEDIGPDACGAYFLYFLGDYFGFQQYDDHELIYIMKINYLLIL